MSIEPRDGGPAFPVNIPGCGDNGWSGMSLRDHFAGQALVGILSHSGKLVMGLTPAEPPDQEHIVAVACYGIADAMLKVRGL